MSGLGPEDERLYRPKDAESTDRPVRPNEMSVLDDVGEVSICDDQPLLTCEDHSQSELKEIAKGIYPDRLHPLIEASEIVSIRNGNDYNREISSLQNPTFATGEYAAVELVLREPLDVGQAHYWDYDNQVAIISHWFGEYGPSPHLTSAEVQEQLVLVSKEKTHVSVGRLLPGSKIVLSELAPRSFSLDSSLSSSWEYSKGNAPPLQETLAVRTFQFELKGEPLEHFVQEDPEMDTWPVGRKGDGIQQWLM